MWDINLELRNLIVLLIIILKHTFWNRIKNFTPIINQNMVTILTRYYYNVCALNISSVGGVMSVIALSRIIFPWLSVVPSPYPRV